MAYGGPSNVRDNFGRLQKYATINIAKHLREVADELQVNIEDAIAKKLLPTYIANVEASYTPRSIYGATYEHTGTFVENITVEIEKDSSIGRDRVKIALLDATYEQPSERTVKQVYEFLTEGTKGGGYYKYWPNANGYSGKRIEYGYNYPTPAHLFEQHTQLQMRGFLESLDPKDYIDKSKHKTKKRRNNK